MPQPSPAPHPLLLLLVSCALATPLAVPRAARAQTTDTALDATERMFHRAITAAKGQPLAQSQDAGQVYTAARSSKDIGLLPMFVQLRTNKFLDNQIYGMIATTLLTKDSKELDLKLLLSSTNPELVGSALASLIDADILTPEQLYQIIADDKEPSHKSMAAGELVRKKSLKDRALLTDLLKSDKDLVRYYTAITMLDNVDPEQTAAALAALKEMSAKHDLRQQMVQSLMLIRVQHDKLTAAIPWVTQIASDEANPDDLRYIAVTTLLALKGPEGLPILIDMMQKQKEVIQQVKLGLVAIEYGAQLTPAQLEPLLKSKSTLAHDIAQLALQASQNTDNTAGVVSLLKAGHPIILEWALDYAERTEGDRRTTLRTAIVNQANSVDQIRDRDYERAAVAAQKLLETDGPAGRKIVVSLLKSDNRAVVEATLVGIYRSSAEKQSELVLPVWEGLIKTTSTESAANYAALILAREGRAEPLTWLPGMILGGTAQGQGFRALAGWYYAKLKSQSDAMLKRAMAD